MLRKTTLNQRLEGIANMTCHNDYSYFRKLSNQGEET